MQLKATKATAVVNQSEQSGTVSDDSDAMLLNEEGIGIWHDFYIDGS